MRTHPHIARPYEIKAAAKQRLKAIVLPLLPVFDFGNSDFATEHDAKAFGHNPFNKCDRIYLQERWCIDDMHDMYFVESTTPEAENIGWEPASTMPQEAAQYWFSISEVKVCQCKNLGFKTMAKTGIHFDCPGIDCPGREAKAVWDYNYPEQPWENDFWVIVLEVEAIAQ